MTNLPCFGYFEKEDHCIGSRDICTEYSHFEKEAYCIGNKTDLGSERASKMELFVTYSHHIEAQPGLQQTSKNLRWRALQK